MGAHVQIQPEYCWSGSEVCACFQREKINKMSEDVTDSNPYSRLMALQRMGIVKDYEQIRNKTVSVIDLNYVCNSWLIGYLYVAEVQM